jgi:hypothetical protein
VSGQAAGLQRLLKRLRQTLPSGRTLTSRNSTSRASVCARSFGVSLLPVGDFFSGG